MPDIEESDNDLPPSPTLARITRDGKGQVVANGASGTLASENTDRFLRFLGEVAKGDMEAAAGIARVIDTAGVSAATDSAHAGQSILPAARPPSPHVR